MNGIISGNMVGGGAAPLKTLILTDENGNELFGVVTGSEQILTANALTDIREGVVAVTDKGIETGSAIIPNYETSTGKKVITSGKEFKITLTVNNMYDYTELQCIICPFNSTTDKSVSAEKVVIDNCLYNSNSDSVVSTITKNVGTKSIDFNFTNTTNNMYIIRYFTYKKLYGE